jgi:hypothetical protein
MLKPTHITVAMMREAEALDEQKSQDLKVAAAAADSLSTHVEQLTTAAWLAYVTQAVAVTAENKTSAPSPVKLLGVKDPQSVTEQTWTHVLKATDAAQLCMVIPLLLTWLPFPGFANAVLESQVLVVLAQNDLKVALAPHLKSFVSPLSARTSAVIKLCLQQSSVPQQPQKAFNQWLASITASPYADHWQALMMELQAHRQKQ